MILCIKYSPLDLSLSYYIVTKFEFQRK